MRIPESNSNDDDQLLKQVAHKVAEIYMAHDDIHGDDIHGEERAHQIRQSLINYEAGFI